jgi:hypothetical protein
MYTNVQSPSVPHSSVPVRSGVQKLCLHNAMLVHYVGAKPTLENKLTLPVERASADSGIALVKRPVLCFITCSTANSTCSDIGCAASTL